MLSQIYRVRSNKKGFTLVEALVAISVFLVIITMVTGIFTNSFATQRKTDVSKVLYEEARIAFERIVKEVRRGTIDYEEYWNRFQYQYSATNNSAYGENYGNYAKQFYIDGDGDPDKITRFDENIGRNTGPNPLDDASSLAVCTPPLVPVAPGTSGYEQCELYLITADGTEKTVIKLVPEDINGTYEYRLEMLKLDGSDSNSDEIIDTWTPKIDFKNYTFQKIQPDSIKITSLKFYVSPVEDPRKAFAEFTNDVQQQPHITIKMTAEPSASRSRGLRGEIPSITLQTTIGGRAQNEVKSSL
ncbi:MAG: type II secretion system protein [Patescibacteria group bacterium]